MIPPAVKANVGVIRVVKAIIAQLSGFKTVIFSQDIPGDVGSGQRPTEKVVGANHGIDIFAPQ